MCVSNLQSPSSSYFGASFAPATGLFISGLVMTPESIRDIYWQAYGEAGDWNASSGQPVVQEQMQIHGWAAVLKHAREHYEQEMERLRDETRTVRRENAFMGRRLTQTEEAFRQLESAYNELLGGVVKNIAADAQRVN